MDEGQGPSAGSDWQDEALAPELPGWPKAVGIISIVWGALGTVCNSCGLAGPAIQAFFVNRLPPEQQAQAMQTPEIFKPGVFEYGVMVVKVPLAILLLVSGILLLSRKPAARTLHLIYGIAGIVLAIAGLVRGAVRMPEQLQWVKDHADQPMMNVFGSPAFLIGSLLLGTLLVAAWPTFCLVWFGLVKKTPESMSGSIDESEAPAA